MYRIGNGYDVHKLAEGRSLILGGVEIPFEKGLLGHSDADVLTHAIADSLLGALCLGDIGRLFPDTDGSYKGISSLLLLERVNELITGNDYIIQNIDTVIVAQQPKLSPYIDDMRESLAKALCCRISQISVKATTEERMGFTGRGEGISAHAVCMLEKIDK